MPMTSEASVIRPRMSDKGRRRRRPSPVPSTSAGTRASHSEAGCDLIEKAIRDADADTMRMQRQMPGE